MIKLDQLREIHSKGFRIKIFLMLFGVDLIKDKDNKQDLNRSLKIYLGLKEEVEEVMKHINSKILICK